MIAAYVVIQTKVGVVGQVVKEMAEIEGVASAEGVTGPYDVIARAEAHNVDELGRLVVRKVQAVPGVVRTLTCPVIRL